MKCSEQVTEISSPIPGKIIKILAHEGDHVEKGQRVFVIESMKMLHELRVPKPGKIGTINVKEGDPIIPNNSLACII